MKKLLVTTAVFIAATIFWGCSSEPKPEPEAECNHCKDYSGQAFTGIPIELAYEMVDQYRIDHWEKYRVGNNEVPTDARSVWFSLDTLKKFIWYIEEKACRNQCVNKDSLGLRFYYAEYPEQQRWADLDGKDDPVSMAHKKLYQNLHTVIILPTYRNSNGLDVDFDPNGKSKEGKCDPASLQETLKELAVGTDSMYQNQNPNNLLQLSEKITALSPDENTAIRNKGSLIPPPPPPSSGCRAGEGNGAIFFDRIENKFFPY